MPKKKKKEKGGGDDDDDLSVEEIEVFPFISFFLSFYLSLYSLPVSIIPRLNTNNHKVSFEEDDGEEEEEMPQFQHHTLTRGQSFQQSVAGATRDAAASVGFVDVPKVIYIIY